MSFRRSRLRSRIAQRGFTLIELMVSLMAGLFVAMAVVALSAQATNTFHEEARTAASEMSIRTAVERLRADLQRAGFMSTGNVQTDPLIARAPNANNMPKTGPYTALYRLAGVHLFANGSANNVPLSVAAGMSPDQIDLAGNFTSTDDYVVRYSEPNGTCTRMWLATDSPAMWRVLGQNNPDATLGAIFQPVAGAQFVVRVADDTGHFQYLPTCNSAQAAGVTGSGITATAHVDIDTSVLPLLTAQQTSTNGGVTGLGIGRLRVNPVQVVRWEVRPIDTSTGDAPYKQLASATNDKYELFREFVDVTGALTNSRELVAEYAVDLKFAFSADLGVSGNAARQLTVYGLSNAQNQTLADDITTSPTTTPQRLRSVHFRLTTRSSIADRAEPFSMPQANTDQTAYPTRYCVLTTCTPGQTGWARVRSITSEVALPNLAKLFF